MPPLVVPNAVLMRLIWTAGGTPYAVNVLGGRKTGSIVIDQAAANSIASVIKGAVTSSGFVGAYSNQVALANVGVRDISAPNNVEFMDAAAAVVGGGAGNRLPPQVAYCVTLRTARAGKSYRGRCYLTGFGVGENSAVGTINSNVRDFAVAFLNAVRTGLPAAGVSLAVVSRRDLSTELVTTCQGRDLIWDTIRGRATAGI